MQQSAKKVTTAKSPCGRRSGGTTTKRTRLPRRLFPSRGGAERISGDIVTLESRLLVRNHCGCFLSFFLLVICCGVFYFLFGTLEITHGGSMKTQTGFSLASPGKSLFIYFPLIRNFSACDFFFFSRGTH